MILGMNQVNLFKEGDKVVAINSATNITKGKIYIVKGYSQLYYGKSGGISFLNDAGTLDGWGCENFEAIATPNIQQELKKCNCDLYLTIMRYGCQCGGN